MLDTNDLVKAIRQAAVEAVRSEHPMDIVHGKIIAVDPLTVELDQKTRLGPMQLELGEALQEHEAEVEIEAKELELELTLRIDGKDQQVIAKGQGKIKGTMKLRRSLDAGMDVILMQAQGGQRYTMFDKVKINDA